MPEIQNGLVEKFSTIRIGLWRITESQDELLALGANRQYLRDIVNIKSSARRLEYLATRALLHDMIGYDVEICHYPSGKPYLNDGRQVGISHTRGYVAIAVSDEYNVALDIEYLSDRVCRIVSKFLRADEHAETTLQKLLVWCAKETLYKLHSEDKLSSYDMKVCNIPDLNVNPTGSFYIENIKRRQEIAVYFVVTDSYILTFAKENISK